MAAVMTTESIDVLGSVTGGPTTSETIESLTREAEQLKAKLDEERSKLVDVDLCVASERLEPLPAFSMKPRRVLKGHQGKVTGSSLSANRNQFCIYAQ